MDTPLPLPKTKRARQREINRRLRAAGYPTVEAFAQSIGKAQSSVSMVISGKFKSLLVATAVCRALGFEHPEDIWPKLYRRDASYPKAS